jgi:hypothetical protein
MAARALAFLTMAAAVSGGARTDDWPQLWGPHGDGRAGGSLAAGPATGTLKARELWRRPLGSGFSGVSVVGDRGYTALSDGTLDHAIAFDARTGRELWRTRLGPTYRGHDGSRDGPISTPTVDGARVFLVGPHGLLVALDGATGRVLWSHDLPKEYGAAVPTYGFATSPVIAGERVVVQVGGEKQHHLVAFDKASGTIAWSAHHGAGAGYVSPVLATLHGVPQLVTVSADKVIAVRPDDGTLLWSIARPQEGEPSRPPLVLPDGRVLVHSWTEAASRAPAASSRRWKCGGGRCSRTRTAPPSSTTATSSGSAARTWCAWTRPPAR